MSQQSPPTRRFRLDLGYDGSHFHGWAKQPGLRTVQGVLEEALGRVLGADALDSLVVAGRTDAGVHAVGQVAHIDVLPGSRIGDDLTRDAAAIAIARRLDGVLRREPDLVVDAVRPVPAEFDARFSATWRSYRYRIADRASRRDPLRRADTLWFPSEIDPAEMQDLAHRLLGFHDWAAFCRPREGATTLRTLTAFDWVRDEQGVLVASLSADAFCHHMVRFLVGASVAVGRGRLGIDEVLAIRSSRRHHPGVVVVPATGLALTAVGYPETADGLAAQAYAARARRVAAE